jgi:pentose-5-phosphate-3-epimerase
MTIRPFLSGRAFDPETIDKMSEALKGVCDTLSLKLVDGPETRLVAQKIIELAQRGVLSGRAFDPETENNILQKP